MLCALILYVNEKNIEINQNIILVPYVLTTTVYIHIQKGKIFLDKLNFFDKIDASNITTTEIAIIIKLIVKINKIIYTVSLRNIGLS